MLNTEFIRSLYVLVHELMIPQGLGRRLVQKSKVLLFFFVMFSVLVFWLIVQGHSPTRGARKCLDVGC